MDAPAIYFHFARESIGTFCTFGETMSPNNKFNKYLPDNKYGKRINRNDVGRAVETIPDILVEHDEKWEGYYKEMESSIQKILSGYHVDRISHIGSTAVHGIKAKDIVDIMIEIDNDTNLEEVVGEIEKNGFVRMSSGDGRVSFNKGYTKEGFADKVYHIHLRYTGDNDELYFRDYLKEHPAVAKEYEALKLELWKKYEHNRDAYTNAKTDFIRSRTAEAREEYGDRY